MKILIMILLGICCITDIRERKISINVLFVFLGIILLWILLSSKVPMLEIPSYPISVRSAAAGILPGIGLLVCSKLFHAAIGEGDGYLFMLLGLLLGVRNTLLLLMGSLLLSAGYALFLLLFRKKEKTETFPFVPFLFAAYFILFVVMNN